MEWYKSWFNTSYYHILYSNHTKEEAEYFIKNIVNFLQLPVNSRVTDLACGKGRHAIYLNQLGFNVTGVDLSEESIAYANQFANENLVFKEHNMLNPFKGEAQQVVFNLFTSYGYFKTDEEDIQVFKNVSDYLEPNGLFVIDYLNADYVIKYLVEEEQKTVQGIDFELKRFIKEGFICKNIQFKADGKAYNFTEEVKAITASKFLEIAEKTGFKLLHLFGNYKLDSFDVQKSQRLIVILQKK